MNKGGNYMHNTNFPPSIDPHTFSIIAVAVGYACVGDYNANEQNSIGNWLILVGQYILTHAAQQQLIESRIENNNINSNSKKAKKVVPHTQIMRTTKVTKSTKRSRLPSRCIKQDATRTR